MKPEELNNRIAELEKQVKEMQDYILGMSGNLNFKAQVGKFAKEAVIQQVATVSDTSPDSELERSINLSGDPETIEVLGYPDKIVFLRDKDNNIYKVPAYTLTL